MTEKSFAMYIIESPKKKKKLKLRLKAVFDYRIA